VWADRYAPTRTDTGYTIAAGDLLNVQVYDNAGMSAHARVRSDGRISLPLLNDVLVEGKAPYVVGHELEQTMKQQNLVLNPRVNVVVEESHPLRVSVLGAVARAGAYVVDPGAGVADALASAGGLTEFAHHDRIFVLRKTPTPVRIRFSFDDLTAGTSKAAAFRLQSGDVVVAQ